MALFGGGQDALQKRNKDQANQHAAELKTIFESKEKFEFVSLVSNGMNGSTCRFRYKKDPTLPDVKDFIIKRAFQNEAALDELLDEKEILERLKGLNHIGQILSIGDQLNDKIDSQEFMIMEWIQHGTLLNFVNKATSKLRDGERLPNRLLWRFFLCLVRACVGMAFPEHEEMTPAADDNTEASGICHKDLHMANVLIGNPPNDPGDIDHDITPILKVIDFGRAVVMEKNPNRAVPTAEQLNIEDIGELMEGLIHLNGQFSSDLLVWQPDSCRFKYKNNWVRTNARSLVPPPEGVDEDLVELVCFCLATRHNNRPSLEVLLDEVMMNREQKTAGFYNNKPEEQDEWISQFLHETLNYADTRVEPPADEPPADEPPTNDPVEKRKRDDSDSDSGSGPGKKRKKT